MNFTDFVASPTSTETGLQKQSLRILLLAPHPFYRERGTPIACKLVCESLCDCGHSVDLLTYAAGDDVSIEGLTIHRTGSLPFPDLHDIPIGFSPKKLVCDALMALKILQMWVMERRRYDVIHAGEESVFLAIFMGFLHWTPQPVVYDMDSSMADQILEKFPKAAPLAWFLNEMERLAFRSVQWVFPVCDALAEKLRDAVPHQRFEILEDVYFEPQPLKVPVENLKYADTHAELPETEPLLMLYVGNLEGYQGIDLLLDSLVELRKQGAISNCWRVKLIGGIPADIQRYQQKINELGLNGLVSLLGPRPLEQLPDLLKQADILLSPRTKGGNTPMKLYSYLASGVPVVATRITSHTQAVDESNCVLVDLDAKSMARGLSLLIQSRDTQSQIGTAGRELALSRFSIQTYRKKLAGSYRHIEQLCDRDRMLV